LHFGPTRFTWPTISSKSLRRKVGGVGRASKVE
jgi:hypothetical protein